MDVVYKAKDMELSRFAALKVLRKQVAQDPKAWNDFAAKRASHRPSIIHNLHDLRDR